MVVCGILATRPAGTGMRGSLDLDQANQSESGRRCECYDAHRSFVCTFTRVVSRPSRRDVVRYLCLNTERSFIPLPSPSPITRAERVYSDPHMLLFGLTGKCSVGSFPCSRFDARITASRLPEVQEAHDHGVAARW